MITQIEVTTPEWEQQDEIETTRQFESWLDVEIGRLNDEQLGAEVKLKELRQQLAASQAYAQQLREALEYSWRDSYNCNGINARELAEHALALPSDTTALSAMIAKAGEVMRERCAVEAYEWAMAYVVEDTAPVGNADAIRALPGVTLEDLK